MDRRKSTGLRVSIVFIWAGLSLIGLIKYNGTFFPYVVFCLAVLWLLISTFHRPVSVGYSCLVTFLSLGFWAKIILHLQLNYPYLEPTGLFDGSSGAWDEVMWVSAVGFLGVGFGRMLFVKYGISTRNLDPLSTTPPVPIWYPPIRKLLWSLTVLLIVGVPIANFFLGVSHSGPVPRLSLPWPLNGLMGWVLAFGLATLVFTLMGWDQVLGRTRGLYAIMIEGAMSGVSSFSRATYIFHTIPAMWVLYARSSALQTWTRRGVFIFVIWFFIFIVSHVAVMGLRYTDTSPLQRSDQGPEYVLSPFSDYFSNLIQESSILIVDRWIGVEGVMAVVAYPHKSSGLFLRALRDRRVRGQLDLYTSEIALAVVAEEDLLRSQYASPPGGVAFFYYTGSLVWVFVGMSMLTIILLASERVVLFLTRNAFIFSFWGMGMAQVVTSYGLGVVQQVMFYGVCFLALGMIWLVQTHSKSLNVSRD